jgi:hypothetical protein
MPGYRVAVKEKNVNWLKACEYLLIHRDYFWSYHCVASPSHRTGKLLFLQDNK